MAAAASRDRRGDGGAAGFLQRAGIQVGRLAQADDDDAGQVAAGSEDGAGLALAALELGRRQGTGDGAIGGGVSFRPQTAGFVALAHQQDQRAGTRQGGFGEADLEHG